MRTVSVLPLLLLVVLLLLPPTLSPRPPSIPQCLPEYTLLRTTISTTPLSPRAVTGGDVNNDSLPDLVVGSFNDDSIRVFLNSANNGFTTPPTTLTSSRDGVNGLFLVDLNNDTYLDLVSTSGKDDTLAWYPNTGSPSGLDPTPLVVSDSLDGVLAFVVADFDGNNSPDLAAVSGADNLLSVFLHVGPLVSPSSHYGPQIVAGTSLQLPSDVVAGDLDGDNDNDLVVSSQEGQFVFWYENSNGDGSSWVTHPVAINTQDVPRTLALADLNGDGFLDVVVGSFNDNKVNIYPNNGVGNFSLSPFFTLTSSTDGVESVLASDLDSDGDLDLLVVSYNDGSTSWFENIRPLDNSNSNSHAFEFGTRQIIFVEPSARGTYAAYIGDLDLNSTPDLAIITETTNTLGWFNLSLASTPPASSRFPASTPASASSSLIADQLPDPYVATHGDYDSDGDIDLAVASFSGNAVYWFRNTLTNTDSPFSARILISSQAVGAIGLASGDLDADGDLDLVSASYLSGQITWYSNTDGKGGFSLGSVIYSNNLAGCFNILPFDADADGDLDLMATNYFAGEVLWFRNYRDLDLHSSIPLFSSAISLHALPNARSLAAGDLDLDGDIDLVAGSIEADAVWWYNNSDGEGSFIPTPLTTVGASSAALVVVDIDSDNDLDILSAYPGANAIAWWENSLFSSPPAPPSTPLFPPAPAALIVNDPGLVVPIYLSVGDINNDNMPDLVMASGGSVPLTWAVNLGDSTFGPTINVSLPVANAHYVGLADLDADGDLDVYAPARDSNSFSWYKQLSRGPFHSYTPTTTTLSSTHSSTLSSTHSSVRSTSPILPFTTLTSAIGAASRCVRDTITLSHTPSPSPSPLVVKCARDTPFTLDFPITITGEGNTSTTLDCDSGVLFHIIPRDDASTTGDLSLSHLRITNTGIAPQAIGGSPGLRVDGTGATLSLSHVALDSGSTTAVPTVLASGNGGCLLAINGAQLFVDSSSITHCSASHAGGGVAAAGTDSYVLITNSVLEGNTAGGSGGGAASLQGGFVALDRTHIVRNVASVVGGGVWVSPSSLLTLRSLALESNTAAGGGGAASCLERDGSDLALASSVVDIPVGDHDANGSPSSPIPLFMAGVDVINNVASKWGGGIFACNTRVSILQDLDDSSAFPTLWESNRASRGGLVSSPDSDIFVCATDPTNPTPFAPDLAAPTSDGIPWVFIQLELWTTQTRTWAIHAPLASLEWVSRFPTLVQAGDEATASVSGRDWFGSPVAYTGVALSTQVAPSPLVGPLLSPSTLLQSRVVALPSIPLRVADPSFWPGNVTLSVSPISTYAQQDGPLPPLPLPTLEADITLGLCSATREPVIDDTGLTSCQPAVCPDNTFRVVANLSTDPCICIPGFWVPSQSTDEPCIPCPPGALCAGATELPSAAPGFFPAEGNVALFLECPRPQSCVGNGLCQEGYRGRLCARCGSNHYSLRGSCFKCKSGVSAVVTLLLVLGGLGVCGVLLLFNLAEGVRYKFVAASIGFAALQISGMYGRLELDWGGFADVYFDVVSSVNLNFELTSPECSLASGADAWVAKLVLTLLLPVFAAAGLGCVGAVVGGLIQVQVGWFASKSVGQLVPAGIRAWFQSLVLLYLPLASAALSVFGCRKDESSRWVLDADPGRSCYNSSWWAGLFPLGLVASCVYALAIPLGVVWVLAVKRKSMDPIVFQLRLGFLVARFAPHSWWFEVAIMVRKLMVVGCMTFFFTPQGKANAAVLVLLGSLLQLALSRPYVDAFHTTLAIVVLTATALTLYAGTFVDFTFRRLGVITGIVINLVAIVGGNAIDLYRMARAEKEVEENEFFGGGVFTMENEDGGEEVAAHSSVSRDVELHVYGEEEGVAVGVEQQATVSSIGVEDSMVETV